MIQKFIIFNILFIFAIDVSLYAQSNDWQEEILSRVDEEDFSEESYKQLMEMLGDLELHSYDTVFPTRIKQNIILRADRCLNIREGYHNATAEKKAANKAYLGDSWNETLRYQIGLGDKWRTGITLNKDAGEKYRRQFPFSDSYSVFADYKSSEGFLRHITVGDFRLRLASGLILNQQFSMGKLLSQDSFMTEGTSFSPSSSTEEYKYMQGAIAELRYKQHLLIIPFISYKDIDAAVSNDTITSIPQDGMHRTVKEAAKRNQTKLFNAGLHLAYMGRWYELGGSFLYTRFDLPYIRPTRTYNLHYFRGSKLFQSSVDYHIRRFGYEFRGETAIDDSLHIASIGTIQHPLGEDWSASLGYRYYDNRYHQLFASSVSESSSMQGETGVLLSVSGTPFKNWTFDSTLDYFHFTNIQYGFKAPLRGFEYLARATYNNKWWNIRLEYRIKYKYNIKHSLNSIISYKASDAITLKLQARGRIYSPQDEGGYHLGYAISQACSFKKESFPVTADVQFTYFDAKDYSTRLYITEKNILYGFGIPSLYGQGYRTSATAVYKISPRISLDLKYAWIHYLNRTSISSDLQKIWGCDQYNVWGQIRLKF